KSVFRSFAATLALSAMLVRALLPAGWMPNPAGPDDAPLVICSVDGLHHAPPAHDPARGQQDEHGFTCPFAAAAHLAPPHLPPAVLPPISTAWLVPPVAVAVAISSPHDPGHAPRGPPIS